MASNPFFHCPAASPSHTLLSLPPDQWAVRHIAMFLAPAPVCPCCDYRKRMAPGDGSCMWMPGACNSPRILRAIGQSAPNRSSFFRAAGLTIRLLLFILAKCTTPLLTLPGHFRGGVRLGGTDGLFTGYERPQLSRGFPAGVWPACAHPVLVPMWRGSFAIIRSQNRDRAPIPRN